MPSLRAGCGGAEQPIFDRSHRAESCRRTPKRGKPMYLTHRVPRTIRFHPAAHRAVRSGKSSRGCDGRARRRRRRRIGVRGIRLGLPPRRGRSLGRRARARPRVSRRAASREIPHEMSQAFWEPKDELLRALRHPLVPQARGDRVVGPRRRLAHLRQRAAAQGREVVRARLAAPGRRLRELAHRHATTSTGTTTPSRR